MIEGFGKEVSTIKEWASTTTPAVVSWIMDDWSAAPLNIVIVDWFEVSADYVPTLIAMNQTG